MEIFIIALAVFTGVIGLMVVGLLFVEAKVVVKGDRTVVINDDPSRSLQVPTGISLLSALT
ncbi:MAG: NADH:ubiquinone reductase (Na(+)-transporting) subunit F, partial [Deltaproteobacteria bacterium]|nr:NADH:ubiquinone reductase (Na(+)-transporting) subunit F [Deltaproteobacteria bacterium]